MTIKEIAQLAGVSSAAVSRYLNGGYVSEEKKEQIRKVIEETGLPAIRPGTYASHQKSKPGGCGRSKDQFRIHQPDHSRH